MATLIVNATSIVQQPNCPLQYSLTGNPADYQTSNVFTNVNVGETYTVRVKDCTDCIHEQQITVPADPRIYPENCPCEPHINLSVTTHGTSATGTGTVVLHVEPNTCCLSTSTITDIKLYSLPNLLGGYNWTTIVPNGGLSFNIDGDLSLDYTNDETIEQPFTTTAAVFGCSCSTPETIEILFGFGEDVVCVPRISLEPITFNIQGNDASIWSNVTDPYYTESETYIGYIPLNTPIVPAYPITLNFILRKTDCCSITAEEFISDISIIHDIAPLIIGTPVALPPTADSNLIGFSIEFSTLTSITQADVQGKSLEFYILNCGPDLPPLKFEVEFAKSSSYIDNELIPQLYVDNSYTELGTNYFSMQALSTNIAPPVVRSYIALTAPLLASEDLDFYVVATFRKNEICNIMGVDLESSAIFTAPTGFTLVPPLLSTDSGDIVTISAVFNQSGPVTLTDLTNAYVQVEIPNCDISLPNIINRIEFAIIPE